MIVKLDKTNKGIELCEELDLTNLLDREVKDLSGIIFLMINIFIS